jgi:hypothetical protein
LIARSAPSVSQARHFSAEPAVANTRAPLARASCIAVVPIPEEPPWHRNTSPALSRPRPKTLVQTVKNVSGMPAASTADRPCGTGNALSSWTTQYSA